MEGNNEEVIEGKSEGFGAVGIIVFIVLGILFLSFFLGFHNPYIPFFGFLVAAFIFYIVLGRIYKYSVYPDKIEVIYPFRKVKNIVIQKNEIQAVKYNYVNKYSDFLIIYYVKGQSKNVVSLRIRVVNINIYETPIYKILLRMKGWGIRLELKTGRKEVVEILK